MVCLNCTKHPRTQSTRGARNVSELLLVCVDEQCHHQTKVEFQIFGIIDNTFGFYFNNFSSLTLIHLLQDLNLTKDHFSNASFLVVIYRWRPPHTSEAEDEDNEPLSANAECGTAERQSPKEPD